MQVRCDVCISAKGNPRPVDCEGIVRYTCAGPEQTELQLAQMRIKLLEKKLSLLNQTKIDLCQCCGKKN